MPIPHFVDQEVLSALRLNALIDAANTLSLLVNSIVVPFEQVQLDEDEHSYDSHGADRWWKYLHKFTPINRYMKIKYQFLGRSGVARLEVWVGMAKVYEDTAGDGSVITAVIDLLGNDLDSTPLNLVDGSINEIRVFAARDGSTYFRLLDFFNSNDGTW